MRIRSKIHLTQLVTLLLITAIALVFSAHAAFAKEAAKDINKLKSTNIQDTKTDAATKTPDKEAPASVKATNSPAKGENEEPKAEPSGSVAPGFLEYDGAAGKNETNGQESLKGEEYSWRDDPARGTAKINIPLTIGSLIVVCVLAYFALKVYLNVTGGQPGQIPGIGMGAKKKLLNIRERQMLGPNKQLCLVDIPGKTLLIGISDNDIKILTEVGLDSIKEIEQASAEELKTKPEATSYLANVLLRKWQQNGK